MMALAPAVGLFLLNDISPAALFFASAAVSFLAVLASVSSVMPARKFVG